MTMSFAANGCGCDDGEIRPLDPALASAICAEGATAAAMNASSSGRTRRRRAGSPSSGRRSAPSLLRVVTQTPQLPSAGWVCVPNVCTPSGRTGRRPPALFRRGRIPRPATVTVFFFETCTSTGTCTASGTPVVRKGRLVLLLPAERDRVALGAGHPLSLLTFSAVWIIAPPATGPSEVVHDPVLGDTCPPGPFGFGTRRGGRWSTVGEEAPAVAEEPVSTPCRPGRRRTPRSSTPG